MGRSGKFKVCTRTESLKKALCHRLSGAQAIKCEFILTRCFRTFLWDLLAKLRSISEQSGENTRKRNGAIESGGVVLNLAGVRKFEPHAAAATRLATAAALSGHEAHSGRFLAHGAGGSLFRPQGALAYALLNPIQEPADRESQPRLNRNKRRLPKESPFIWSG